MQPKIKPKQSPSNTPNIELQARDLELLKGLFESRLATLAQLAELHFDGKKEAVQNRVKKLKDAGFLKERPRASVGAPSIVHLSRRGFETLTERGMLARYPRFIWSNLEDRAKVSPITLKHELNVMNIKATFARELRAWDDLALAEFCTWPMLYEFKAKTHEQELDLVKVKPDGFFILRLPSEQQFFLSRSRSRLGNPRYRGAQVFWLSGIFSHRRHGAPFWQIGSQRRAVSRHCVGRKRSAAQ
jgi:hypothetical protein